MLKLLFLMPLLLILAACGSSGRSRPDTEDVSINMPYPTMVVENITPDSEAYVGRYLLPDIPQFNNYTVSLEVDPETRTIQGMSQITFTNRSDKPLEQIVMRAFLNAFQPGVYPRPYLENMANRMELYGTGRGYMVFEYASIDSETLQHSIDGTVLTLNLQEPLEPWATVHILLQYSAYAPKLGHSIGGNDYAMWFGMFLPVLAVHDENGWHTDNFYPVGSPFFLETSSYHVSITTPIRYEVIGTGHSTEELIEDDDVRITRFSAYMTRDFSFAVLSPYYNRVSTQTASGVEINFYYHTNTAATRYHEILNLASFSMEYFEYRVGIYPAAQINIVETSLIQGNKAFSQTVFLDTNYIRHSRLTGLSNSLARQWFSSTVGTNRVRQPWLDTGLTRFIQAGIVYDTPEKLHEHIESEREIIDGFEGLSLTDGLWAYTDREEYINAQGRLASIMLYELQQLMGEELFWQFISRYYQMFSFQIATVDDFISTAEAVYGRTLRPFFEQWGLS